MKNIIKRYMSNKFIIIGIIVIFFLPILVIALYNHPNFDDYSYSINTYHTLLQNKGILSLIISAFKTSFDFMYTWQGLYSSAVLLSLQPGIFGESFYSLTTVIMLLIIFIGLYFFVKSFNKYILKINCCNKLNFLLSFILLFFLIETCPSAREAIYWYNGAMNYLFFWSLMLVILALIIKYINNCQYKFFFICLLSFLSFVLSGGNHVTAFAGIMIEIITVLYCFIKKENKELLIPLFFSVSGFIINIKAPGTKIRSDALMSSQSVFDTVHNTFLKSFELFGNWLSISLICLIIVLFCLLWGHLAKLKINYSKKFIIIPIVSYIFMAGMMCVPYFALGTFGAGRVYNTLYFTFVLLFVINILLLCKYLYDKKIIRIKFQNNLKLNIIIIICILFIGIFGNNFYYFSTSYEAYKEIKSGEAKYFSEQTYDRVKKLTSDDDKIIVEPYKYKPYLLYGIDFCEISKDNKCNNNAINKYYNKKVVAISSK